MSIVPNRMPGRTVVRNDVYNVIDGEREYQNGGHGNAQRHANAPPQLTPGEVILCMEKCLADARDAWYKPNGATACLPFIRKTAALAVQVMENYGAPAREGFDPRVEQL